MSHVAYAPQMDSPPPRRGHTRTMSNVSTDECVPRRCPPRFRDDVVRCVRPSRIDALKTPDPFPYPFPVVLRLMSSPLDSSFGVELGGARPPRVGHVRSLSGTLEDITVSAEADLTAARATSLAVTRETCRRWCVRHSWIPTAVFVLGILLMAAVPGIAILTNRGADPPRVSEVALFVVGDWGREGSVSQNACADAMAAVAPSLRASITDAAPGSYFGVISTGDNFYEDGLSSVDDPAFARSFVDVYGARPDLATLAWHAVLGNHDHRGNVTAQIARRAAANASAGEPGWDAMRRGYREFGGEETGDAGVVGVCFVDTTPWIVRYRDEISRYPHMETMLRDAGGSWSAWEEVEMAWLDTCLTESHAAWRVVVGHHPVASHATTHGSARELDRVREIVERLGAVAYFNGHDHNLQHVVPATAATTPGGTPPMATRFVTSGAGSRTRDDVPVVGAEGTPEELKFARGTAPGFAVVYASRASFRIAYRGAPDGRLLYEDVVA